MLKQQNANFSTLENESRSHKVIDPYRNDENDYELDIKEGEQPINVNGMVVLEDGVLMDPNQRPNDDMLLINPLSRKNLTNHTCVVLKEPTNIT